MNKEASPPPSPPRPAVVKEVPRSGETEPWSGLKRTQLDMVTRPQASNGFNPPVNSHIFAGKGAARGVRLINLESLLAYVNGLANTQPKKSPRRARDSDKR